MTTQEYDTDPSTPGAKRQTDPRGGDSEVGQDAELSGSGLTPEVPSRARHNTDPGIAPPPAPLPVPVGGMGVVVPPAARTANDTVDALLDGIRREHPQSRGTPQTDGQVAASYHSEHSLRAAQVAVREEPKVVIERERPLLAQTVRIRMTGSKVSVLPYGSVSTDATAVNARPVVGRMVIAVLAGVVVVLLIFVALQRISAQVTPAQASALQPSVTPQAAVRPTHSVVTDTPPVGSETEMIAAGRVATESQPTTASSTVASSAVEGTAPRKPPSPAKSTKPKAKPTPSATKPASDDLGEFKTAF